MSGFLVPPPPPGLSPGPVPTFSVLIGAYQAAATAPEAVASALEQTVAPLEVIVCDDGSTDDLTAALAPWADRITLLRKQNGGGASAVNAALRVATGDFVAVLDADDAYAPTRLERLGELSALRPDLDLLATDAYFERDGQVVGRFIAENPFPTQDQRRVMLQRSLHPHAALRRERVTRLGGWDESLRIVYDWDCYLRMVLSGTGVGLVDEPLLHYRLSEHSLSGHRAASLGERARWQATLGDRVTLEPEEWAVVQAGIPAIAARALDAARQADDRDVLRALARTRGLPRSIRFRALVAGMGRRA